MPPLLINTFTNFTFVIGKVQINGHIGESYVDGKGQLHKGTVLLDVIEQCESFPDATELEVYVNSPGGYADVGDSIYDYLVSQKKKGKTITTIQTGLVGSIATKIFLAGDRRIVDDRYKFWIHNPFMDKVSGDQDQLRAMAKDLEETEKNLRKFYGEFTSITDEGLDGLMKIETGLTADQCIKFKFATEKKLVPAFNTIKMKPEEVKDSILALLGVKVEPKKTGVKPKAQKPDNNTQSMVVNLADGAGSFWVEGEALTEGAGCFLLDAEGQPTQEPVADGDYPVDDGSMVSVAGGKISKVTPAVEGKTSFTKEELDAAVLDALTKAKAESQATVEAVVAKVVDEKILAFKKDVKLGIQPKPAALKAPGATEPEQFKTIAQIQIEREKARKTNRK